MTEKKMNNGQKQSQLPEKASPDSITQLVSQKWTKEDRELIWRTVAPRTTASEFKLFLYMAYTYGLDPLLKEIWCVKYPNEPARIFVGRDGFIKIAHKIGAEVWDGMETVVEKVKEPINISRVIKGREKTLKRDWQYKATCKVWRKDMSHPFVVEVYEEEYNQLNETWLSKPRTMLAKVAESQCLRKAFNIHGIYSDAEEWGNGSGEKAYIEAEAQEVKEPVISEEKRKLLHARAAEKGYTHEDIKAIIAGKPWGYESTKDIKVKDFEDILKRIEELPDLRETASPTPLDEEEEIQEDIVPQQDLGDEMPEDIQAMFNETGIVEVKQKKLWEQYKSDPEELRRILNKLIDQQIIGEGDGILF